MAYFDDCLKKYNNLSPEIKSAFGAPEIIAKLTALEGQYKVKLDFVVILVAIEELELEDVAEYLEKKLNVQPEMADEISGKLEAEIFSSAFARLPAVATDVDLQNLSMRDKKQVVLAAFTNSLSDIFNDNPDYYADLNIIAFQVFNDDPNFEDKAVEALYGNQEVLTKKPFIVNGNNQPATAANWIKDFIKENGSDLFDNLVLSRYFSISVNARILDPEEKKIISKLLKLYRNLVFFPESMKGIPVERWELFPIERIIEEPIRSANFNTPVGAEPAKPEPVKPIIPAVIEKKMAAVQVARPIVSMPEITPPAPTLNPEVKKLQELLKQYPADSLEGKAIAAELKSLRTK